jgi:hypothetical protein
MLACEDKLVKKVALLKRLGLFDPNSPVTVRRAVSRKDLQAAYQLVHSAFVEKGYIEPRPGGLRIRTFETLPEMATFVAELEQEIIAVMSIVPDSEAMGLPSDGAFGQEIDSLRRSGRRVCEITNLAVVGQHRRSNAFPELTRACFAQALAWQCDDIFIAISPGHAAFFEGVLQFEPFGDQRSYSAEKEDVVEGKRLDLGTIDERWRQADRDLGDGAFLHDYYFKHNSYHHCVRRWSSVARRAFLEPELLRELFVEQSGFLQRCRPEVLEAICRCWGDAVFDQVCSRETAELRVA